MRKTVFFLSACAGVSQASDALFNKAWGFTDTSSQSENQPQKWSYLPVKSYDPSSSSSYQPILPVQEIKEVVKTVAKKVYSQPEQEYIIGSPNNNLFSWGTENSRKNNYLPVKTETYSSSWFEKAKSYIQPAATTTTKAATTTTQAPKVYQVYNNEKFFEFPKESEKSTFQTTYYKPFFNWNDQTQVREPVYSPVRVGYSQNVVERTPVLASGRTPLVISTVRVVKKVRTNELKSPFQNWNVKRDGF